jgi:SAM-dependent methyltransferase
MRAENSGGYANARLAELYDQVPAYVSREDVALFVEEAVASGGPVLELGCGTGRVLLPTARAGVAITGLDLSQAMLGALRRKLAQEPAEVQARVRLVHGDMCEFDLGQRFACVTIPFRPFQHLITVAEQMACLRSANRHLARGGRLVLDLFHPDLAKLADPGQGRETQDFADAPLPGGGRVSRTHRFAATHRAEQYNDVEMIYHVTGPDGRTERIVHTFPFRYVFRYEMEHLLARCGFRVAELFGDFDLSPFADDSPQMIFVAEKCAEAPC